MGSHQGSLRQGQKRGHEQQLGDGPQVVVRRRLAADTTTSFPTILTPWPHTSTSNPLFHPGHFDLLGRPISLRTAMMCSMVDSEYPNGQNGNVELGGAAAQLPLSNLPSAGIPSLLRYSTNGHLDSIFTKEEMYPNCGAYNHPNHVISAGENGFVDSDISRQLFLGYSGGNEVENMRQALGKDVNRSPAETACQNAGSKFTLMGEPVEKSTGIDSSDPLQKMPTLAPQFGSRPRGLFALGPYLSDADYNCMTTGYAADLANLNSDKVPAPPGSNPISYPNYMQSRCLYRGSLADRCGSSSSSSSIPFGLSQGSFSQICGNSTIMNDPSASFHASVGLKMGRHTGPGNLLSFEASNFAIQEYLRNNGNSPAEPGTSKIAFKSGTVRRKDKDNSNIFPANVKSLLSTGIFDGVPVKYVSWDRSKNVRGTIQGTGYLCWCENCNKTKTVNAYQLEQHAGSKSKHPNDHIYFSNGKSIYGVVQELKNTPSDRLLEVIPTVTGSGINKANFSKWKDSFQAAGRELHRIFGSEPAETPSQDVGLLAARERGRPDGHPPAE
ncbi:unnamed protein product [Rhodiola kirilowii]